MLILLIFIYFVSIIWITFFTFCFFLFFLSLFLPLPSLFPSFLPFFPLFLPLSFSSFLPNKENPGNPILKSSAWWRRQNKDQRRQYNWWTKANAMAGASFFQTNGKSYVMAAGVANSSISEIRFPRRYNIYFINNTVVAEFQCYSECNENQP